MAATLTVTVTDATGAVMVDALVRAYQDTTNGPSLQLSGRTNGSGQVSGTVPAGNYRIHVDPVSNKYMDQWYGGLDMLTAPVVVVGASGTVTVPFILQLPLDPQAAEDRPLPLFWKDTTNAAVLVLYPGEERAAIEDITSPIYKHPLVGPFLTSAKAAAA